MNKSCWIGGCLLFIMTSLLALSCNFAISEGRYDYVMVTEEDGETTGVMIVSHAEGGYEVLLRSLEWGDIEVENVAVNGSLLSGSFKKWGDNAILECAFSNNQFSGRLKMGDEDMLVTGKRQSNEQVLIDRTGIAYLLLENAVPDLENEIDHAGIIFDQNQESFERGARIYNSNCINCHGNEEVEGSIPLSLKFWNQPFKAGSDAFSMYEVLTRGHGAMPPQLTLTPLEKHDVILYIREEYVRKNETETFVPNTPGYVASLPKGTSKGPVSKPYQPWADMDYGNFFINTYELVDETTGPPRYHSPGPVPYTDEDYSKNNFAYKGIAVRLDKGDGGISKGKAWMIFDHDVMRVAGGWTGEGFIDWNAILLNDRHETYPRTIGKLHFETPVGPGWANPLTGKFDDPRFTARDGRQFGPLPREWADYKGIYHNGDHIIISYSVGRSIVLEELGMVEKEGEIIFTRTLDISPSNSILKMKVAPQSAGVEIKGNGANLSEEDGFVMMNVRKSTAARVTLFISGKKRDDLNVIVKSAVAPASLKHFIKGGGPPHYPEIIKTEITKGSDDSVFAVDQLTPPFENPWNCRMKLSGIDFMEDGNTAIACATDGDIWKISGLTSDEGVLSWQRIGSGLFQPLGLKILSDKIFVICRDQLVLLRDFNGDGETDFYESFNHDHQVSDHFHEFAMGLQADKEGNLYYAKSGRHAREALIPQHGTLLKVSKDGSKTDIVATGFRAANGVCINSDGSFIVTDQQGYWNPMNRINWVRIGEKEKFYGNMWGYNPPKDTSRAAMEPPMVWVDMQFDRSPSELLWVDSKQWGPLDKHLLSFSYGYGKIQLVLPEDVKGVMQGGVIDLPGIKFLTGVMRGRFNQDDGNLYACGMSAWGTSQLMKGGGLYRIRYTGKPLPVPVSLSATVSGLQLSFASSISRELAENIDNYKIQTWNLVRSSTYGSDRYNEKNLGITRAELESDGKTVMIYLNDITPVDVMTITYNLEDLFGNALEGTVQNTIHNLSDKVAL